MKRTICLLVLSVFFAGSLAACNTVKGAGEDVQSVGQAGEEVLDDVKD